MSDLEFLERLKRELLNSPHWSDLQGVASADDDRELAANELRVYPSEADPNATSRSVFRLIVEWETTADTVVPERWTVTEQRGPP